MNESDFYSRQTILKNVGRDGQDLMGSSRVLVVGAGGLGHPVASYLAAAGIGTIGLVDVDVIEGSNLNRQVLFSAEDVGQKKTLVLAQKLRKQNPFITVKTIEERITIDNAQDILSNYELLVDCTDNFATKFLLHDYAWMNKKDLVQASIFQYEGQLQVFNFSNPEKREKGCLRCLWPNTPEADCVGNCAQAGVIGAVAGSLGTFQAMEVIKLILKQGRDLTNVSVTLDLMSMEMRNLKWKKDSSCPLCSESAVIKGLKNANYFTKESYELEKIDPKSFICIDIREEGELEFENLVSEYELLKKSLSAFEEWKQELDREKEYLFICSKGIRSRKLVERIREEGRMNCYSLYQGLESYEL